MGPGSIKALYLNELSCLYDAEIQVIRTLPRLSELTRFPQLRELLQGHAAESRLHLERLQLIFTHWGERVTPHACGEMIGIIQDADDRLNRASTERARDAAVIAAAMRMEQYEISVYGRARSYALQLNRPDDARLLQETLDEGARVDRRLSEIADGAAVRASAP